MAADHEDLPALIASRICHDLISPIGAINNGLELLQMSGAMAGPELELIADSVTNANARVRFFRVAFGAAGDQQLNRAEIISILGDVAKGGRMGFEWKSDAGASRSDTRMAFLAALCLETGLPYGGHITMSYTGAGWSIRGEGRKVAVDDTLWSRLTGTEASDAVIPAQVHFALLPRAAAEEDRKITYAHDDDSITITF